MEARYTGTSQQHMDVIYIKLKPSCGKYDVKFWHQYVSKCVLKLNIAILCKY